MIVPPFAMESVGIFFGPVQRSEFARHLADLALNAESVTRRLPVLTAGKRAIVAALAANRLGELNGGER